MTEVQRKESIAVTIPSAGGQNDSKKSPVGNSVPSPNLTGSPDGKGGQSKISAAYSKDTDTSIFALGEAASALDDIDDILSGVSQDIKEKLEEDSRKQEKDGKPPSGKSEEHPVKDHWRLFKPVEDDSDIEAGSSVQVSNITKTFPDGRTVETRIVQGPVRRNKRIVRVMKETPAGQVLLAEVESPPDCDVNKILDLIPPSILLGSGRPIKRRRSNGQYDNWKGKVAQRFRSDNRRQLEEDQDLDRADENLLPNGGIYIPSSAFNDADYLAELSQPAGKLSRLQKFKNAAVRKASIAAGLELRELDDLHKKKLRLEGATEDGIQTGEHLDEEQLAEDQESEELEKHSICWSCARIIKTKSRHSMPKSFIKMSKGKYRMTSAELSDESSVPTAQSVVASYARMLVDDRAKFVETMFRAVKLNKLDVTKILCKIILKTGFTLGHHDFRETESSATILHVAMLYNHVDIVDFLLGVGDRELIMARYETKEYHNQTSLHVAVANGNTELVEKLLQLLTPEDQSELVNTMADGHYFKEQHPHGQLCLTSAAWAGSGQVIKMIVKYGGKLDKANLQGNTLLHSIILQAAQYPERSDYRQLFDSVFEATDIWAEQMSYDSKFAQQRELEKNQMRISLFRRLLNCKNNDGLSPLALAMVKNSKLFSHIVNLEKVHKIPQNKLGSIAWVTYDVTEIASFAQDKYNKFSVLHILAHNSQHLSRQASLEQDEDYMEMEPIQTLLIRKWDVYRWIYILWFVVHLSYMITFTASTIEVNSVCQNITACLIDSSLAPRKGLATFLVLPVFYLCFEMLDLFGTRPYKYQYMTGNNVASKIIRCIKSEWTITGNGPYRMVCVGFSIFTFYWFVLYMTQDDYQDMGLAMSLLLGWIFVLFFTRGCRVTCRFSIMIQKMFFRDLIYFLTVYAIVLVGFSFAMNNMFETSNLTKVFYDMMSVVTDLDKKQTVHEARHPMFAKLLLILYAIIAVILLMNMLIAMMNTSYETVRVTRCNLWRQQQLSVLLLIERRFFWLKWLCRKSERDVWSREAAPGEDTQRCYIDVTMLNNPGRRGYNV